MKQSTCIILLLLFAAKSMAQQDLPGYMKNIAAVYGTADGRSIFLFSEYSSPTFRMALTRDKELVYAGFVYGREVYSPNGLRYFMNSFPAHTNKPAKNGIGYYDIKKDWWTGISSFRRDSAGRTYMSSDTGFYEQHFGLAITNEGLLVCSGQPRFRKRHKLSEGKDELIGLKDIYVLDSKTGKKTMLHTGTIWENDSKYFRHIPKCGLTPDGRCFYFNAGAELKVWEIATGRQTQIKSPFVFDIDDVSIGNYQCLVRGSVDTGTAFKYPKGIHAFNIYTGASITQKLLLQSEETEPQFVGDTIYTVNRRKAMVSFYTIDSTGFFKYDSVSIDTAYIKDFPADTYTLQVITPTKLASFTSNDKLYIMDLRSGKGWGYYADIRGRGTRAREYQEAQKECLDRKAAMKFAIGATVVNKQGRIEIVEDFNCFTNEYKMAYVQPGEHHPPYSSATILRYDLKPAKGVMTYTYTVQAGNMAEYKASIQKYTICTSCRGKGGLWHGDYVQGPSVLFKNNSDLGQYKPLGTMVYNYLLCADCLGKCWVPK